MKSDTIETTLMNMARNRIEEEKVLSGLESAAMPKALLHAEITIGTSVVPSMFGAAYKSKSL